MSFIKHEEETQGSINFSGEDGGDEDEELLEAKSSEIYYKRPSLNFLDGTFFQYIPEKSTNNKLVALCMKCYPLPVEVKGYGSCTSNFISHLKRRHGEPVVEEYRTYMKMKKSRVSQSPRSSCVVFNQEQILQDYAISNANMQNFSNIMRTEEKPLAPTAPTIVNYIPSVFAENIFNFFSSTLISTSIIENTYFKEMFLNLNVPQGDLQMLTQQSLERQIATKYELHKRNCKIFIAQLQHLSLSIHLWPSEKILFMGLVAHWLTRDLSRKSILLGVREISNENDAAELITKQNQKLLTEFDIDLWKLRSTLIDFSKDYLQEFKTLGIEANNIIYEEALAVENSIMCNKYDFIPQHDLLKRCTLSNKLICPVHLLSKAMTAAFEQTLAIFHNTTLSQIHNSTMIKCNLLWQAAGDLNRTNIIQNILHLKLERPHFDNWRSVFSALKQISALGNYNEQLHEALNLNNALHSNEFCYLHEFLNCTTPIMEALDILQAESNSYFGILLPCLFALKRNLKKTYKQINFIYCQPLLDSYINNISIQFEEYFQLKTENSQNSAIAALSYPRFKNQWLLCCVEPKQRFEILNAFKLAISEHTTVKEVIKEETVQENKALAFFDFGEDTVEDSEIKNSSSQLEINLNNAVEAQVMQFFAEESKEMALLELYPEIKKVFIQYNTPLPSLAMGEKLFPTTIINALKRNPTIFNPLYEKRIILNTNL